MTCYRLIKLSIIIIIIVGGLCGSDLSGLSTGLLWIAIEWHCNCKLIWLILIHFSVCLPVCLSVWVERFHTYLYGRSFTIITDHKPLEMICNKPIASAPPRLQRMLVKIQGYDYSVEYRPGNKMIMSDVLSRLPSPSERSEVQQAGIESRRTVTMCVIDTISPCALGDAIWQTRVVHVTQSVHHVVVDGVIHLWLCWSLPPRRSN